MAGCLKLSEDEKTTYDEEKDSIVESSKSCQLSAGANLLDNVDVEEKPKHEKKKKSTPKKSKKNEDKTEKPKKETFECPICLESAVFPIRISCGHIFCFLCVKGAAQQVYNCPMCRQRITIDFDKSPILLECPDSDQEEDTHADGCQWFYESKAGGWWQYDKITSKVIEQNYQLNNKRFDLLICGTIYTIDLDRSLQYNSEDPIRRRKIKRENANNLFVKGIAGVN